METFDVRHVPGYESATSGNFEVEQNESIAQNMHNITHSSSHHCDHYLDDDTDAGSVSETAQGLD